LNDGPKPSESAVAAEDEEPQHTKNGFANLQNLLQDAYGDSDALTPIFFLITHSVNIVDLVTEYHTKT
jgi:dynein heavy chain